MSIGKCAVTASMLILTACTGQRELTAKDNLPMMTPTDLYVTSPAMAHNTADILLGEVWKRPGLSARDRSLVTVTLLIARGQSAEMDAHLELALHNGVTALELSETINHLAFYAGWGNASGAAASARQVFERHAITADQLAPIAPALLPLDQAAERARVAIVDKTVGPVSPGLVQYTTSALFNDLWLRPGLAPRDRSLVTVAALVANGQVGQISYHLNRAMDNGLTQSEASELLTHLAFYAGWPNAFSAVPVFNEVFSKRQSG